MKILEFVKKNMKEWNTEVFGDICVTKSLILETIVDIDKIEERGGLD